MSGMNSGSTSPISSYVASGGGPLRRASELVSRLSGHVLSARDARSPVVQAQLRVQGRQARTSSSGGYEVILDGLPTLVEVEIQARGYHPHWEQLTWASVANGGLLHRDFHLVPEDVPLLRVRAGDHQKARSTTPLLPSRLIPENDDMLELELEDDLSDEITEELLSEEEEISFWMESSDLDDLDWEERQLFGLDEVVLLEEPSLEPPVRLLPR